MIVELANIVEHDIGKKVVTKSWHVKQISGPKYAKTVVEAILFAGFFSHQTRS